MNSFNLKMFQLILRHVRNDKKLRNPLFEILNSGFVMINECYFLKKLFEQQTHVKASDFIDKTGYECFINSIHIDDFVESDFFIQGMLFSETLINEWNKLNNNLTLEAIISETDYGINIKFHMLRQNESWIKESELNKFEEAILICNSV